MNIFQKAARQKNRPLVCGFEEAYQAQFDKVINYNRDGSIISKKLDEIKKRWLWDEKDTVEENLRKSDAFWEAVDKYGG